MKNLKKIFEEQRNSNCTKCLVKECSVLKNCPNECLELFSSYKHVIFFDKGQRIREENESKQILFIKSGKIKIYKTDKAGNEIILRLAKKGDIIGFKDLEKDGEDEESAMAVEDTFLCYIDQTVFLQLIRLYPELALELINYYKIELRNSENKNIKLVKLNVPGKVAYALLTIYDAYGSTGKGSTLNLSLSRQEIADMAGTTKEQVSKVLSEFHEQGIIYTKSKQIDLLNIQSLRTLAKV